MIVGGLNPITRIKICSKIYSSPILDPKVSNLLRSFNHLSLWGGQFNVMWPLESREKSPSIVGLTVFFSIISIILNWFPFDFWWSLNRVPIWERIEALWDSVPGVKKNPFCRSSIWLLLLWEYRYVSSTVLIFAYHILFEGFFRQYVS